MHHVPPKAVMSKFFCDVNFMLPFFNASTEKGMLVDNN